MTPPDPEPDTSGTDAPSTDDWTAFTPGQLAVRLSEVDTPWHVAAGWALDLFRGGQTRQHGDLEIAVPHWAFGRIRACLPECDIYLPVGQGRLRRLDAAEEPPEEEDGAMFKTWALDRVARRWRLDVFREAERDGRWVCRRLPELTLPYDEIVLRTEDGIPFLVPELALLFKAKHAREKDEADFHGVLPLLGRRRRKRLHDLLNLVHPNHRWLVELT